MTKKTTENKYFLKKIRRKLKDNTKPPLDLTHIFDYSILLAMRARSDGSDRRFRRNVLLCIERGADRLVGSPEKVSGSGGFATNKNDRDVEKGTTISTICD